MKKTIAILLAAILAIMLLAACGGNDSDASYSGGTGGGSTGAFDSQAGSGSGSSGGDGGVWPAAPPAEADFYGDADRLDSLEESDASPIADTGSMVEKIIYTADADIETVDFDETIQRVYDMLEVNGAFIENSYIGGRNYTQSYHGYQTYRSANFTLRVPKERFEAVTGSLDVLGNVTSLRTNAQNITAQFYDTNSRLTSFRIQEERLLEILAEAETVTDMISLESRLADIRYNIETLTSTLRNWQGQVDYSTLSLYIFEVERYTESVPIQRTYWQQMGDGLASRTRGVGEFFKAVFMWFVVNLPVFGVLAVIALAIILVVRRQIQKDKKRYPPRNPPNDPKTD